MTARNKEFEAIKRIRELLILQNELKSAFPENEYNVFVFGSYPTVRFSKDKSDVDIAVYADSLEMYKKMSVIIENFFEEKNIPVDLFFIDINTPAPFFLAPLRAQIQFTDYYPEKLRKFEEKCLNELTRIKRSMAV